VALGEVTVEKNKALPDASTRERVILVAMALVILFMGIASPLFTRRMEPATNVLLEQMTGRAQNATQPASAVPAERASLPAGKITLKVSGSRVRP
jgi:NADH:ubiquinone oxidoreductase subunit 4 (subunit M)